MNGAELPLADWDNFYMIIGSSAGALTGLQFVVMTLIAGARGVAKSTRVIDTFATPTIVHFCAALVVSAVLAAPWHRLFGPAIALGCCAVAGIVYTAIVIRRARRQTVYRPVLEDWIWHAALPLFAYAALLIAAGSLPRYSASSLFAIAAITMLILFVGIHNAWDGVVYIAVELLPSADREGEPHEPNETDPG